MSKDKLVRSAIGIIAGLGFALLPAIFTAEASASALGCNLLQCTSETCCWISTETDTICHCKRIDPAPAPPGD